MSVFSQIVAELSRADSQPRDWYGWTTNQMGHAFSFMALAILFEPWIAALLTVAKETADGFKTDNRQGWRDCATDLLFSLSGVALVAFPAWQIPVLIAVAAVLAAGIVKRVRAA
jgi:hypothetical protein